MAQGLLLKIPEDYLQKLEDADKKIEKLATTSESVSHRVNNAFRSMSTSGLSEFVEKLNDAKKIMDSIGSNNLSKSFSAMSKNASSSIDKINRISQAVDRLNKSQSEGGNVISSRSVDEWNELQRKINSANEQMNRMIASTKQYEATIKSINSGKGGMLSANSKQEYEYNQRAISVIREQVKEYRQKQQAIVNNNIEIRKQETLLSSLKRIESERTSLPNQRSKEKLAEMREYYKNLEKESEKAQKNKEKEERAAKRAAEAETRAAKRAYEAKAKLYKSQNQEKNRTFEGAIAFSKTANTINRQIVAIKNLEAARNSLSKTDSNYLNKLHTLNNEIRRNQAEIDKAKNKASELSREHSHLMDVSGQLARKIALLFSVSAIQGYVNKLVEVRGEFELQQRSLQSILQNKDEADKLWGRTLELAVKSPFRVGELVSYTKQLAAYRVETDKLYETNKMLADVSAGLGVDMQRLILAFGQVKAANYLRGTELRQFSEAGINILGELSKYFTELEGRAISVGDVFEMVSKRMVSFADVEEVFKRITSAGGIFYNMQEVQSETLKGQISNLRDSIDIMLNSIGKENDSTIKGMVSTLRGLVENWREIAVQIEAAVAVMGIWKISNMAYVLGSKKASVANSWVSASIKKKVGSTMADIQSMTLAEARTMGLTKKQFLLAKSSVVLQGSLRGIGLALKTIAPFALLFGLEEIIRLATKGSRDLDRLKESISNVVNEDSSNLFKSVDAYKDLVERLKEANQGSKERREIMSSLNSQYGEYLDFVVDENTSIKELTDSYDSLVKRMKEKSSLATFQKGMQEISDYYGKSLEDAKESFYELFEGASIKNKKSEFGSIIPTKKEIDDIYSLIQTKIEQLEPEQMDSFKEQAKIIQDIIKNYYGEDFFLDLSKTIDIDLIDILLDRMQKEKELEENINVQYKETLKSREANLELEKLQSQYNEKKKKIISTENLSDFQVKKQLDKAATDFEIEKIELKFKFGEISEKDMNEEKDKILNWSTETVKSVNDEIKKIAVPSFPEELYDKVLISKDEQSEGISSIIKNTESAWNRQNDIIAQQISLKSEGRSIDEDLLEKAEKMKALYEIRAKVLGIELKLVKKISKESVESINSQLPKDYQISLEDSYKSIQDLQDEANKKMKKAIQLQEILNNQKAIGVAISEEEYKSVSKDVENYTLLWKLLGGKEKEKKPRQKKDSLMDERLRVIDDIHKAYKELNKTLSETESKEGAISKYSDAFYEAYKGTGLKLEDFDFISEEGMVKFYDKVMKLAKKNSERIKVELAKGEVVMETKVRIKKEDDKGLLQQIEDMFSGYELSLELQKLNIPSSLAEQLFDVESLSLPELKDRVLELEPKFVGTDMEEEYRKFLQKIDDMEDKAQVERLKKYTKYLVKSQGERVKIKLDELRQIREVEEEEAYTPKQKEEIKSSIRKESKEKMDKEEWNDFKDSELYLKIFEDLEYVSTSALDKITNKLNDLKSNLSSLSPSDIKTINDQLEKIADIKVKRSPFKALKESYKDYFEYLKHGKEAEKKWIDASNKEAEIKKQKDFAEVQVAEAQYAYEEKLRKLDKAKERGNLDEINSITKEVVVSKQLLDTNKKIFNAKVDELVTQGKITKEYANTVKKGERARKVFTGSVKDIGSDISELGNILPQVAGDLEHIFGKMSGSMADAISSASEIASGVGGAIEGFASGNYLQGAASAIKAVSSIFSIGDKKRERQIQKEIRLVENLQYTYEKLEKAVDDAYSVGTLRNTAANAEHNLRVQISATYNMIEAERGKKDSDQDRIDQWKRDIDEMKEKLKELEAERLQSLGGFGSESEYKSAAEQFADAWYEAFKETGVGLDSLQESFDSFIDGVVKKQLLVRGTEKLLEPLLKLIDKAVDDAVLTREELDGINDTFNNNVKEQLDELYKSIVGDLGVRKKPGSMSGLQEGIQGITEPTAQIIEAYLNSMRFFVADTNAKLNAFVNSFNNAEVQNPIISHLKVVAEQTEAIHTLLNSLTAPHPTLSGRGLKVII